MNTQNLAGYPEITFSAANFFGPTPPQQMGNGPQILNQTMNSGPSPATNWHAVGVLAVLIIGGYLVWHFSFEK